MLTYVRFKKLAPLKNGGFPRTAGTTINFEVSTKIDREFLLVDTIVSLTASRQQPSIPGSA
jgi:hypothetical protein